MLFQQVALGENADAEVGEFDARCDAGFGAGGLNEDVAGFDVFMKNADAVGCGDGISDAGEEFEAGWEGERSEVGAGPMEEVTAGAVFTFKGVGSGFELDVVCLLYTSPSPRD